MQTLKPVLAVIEYDGAAPLDDGFLPVLRVTEVDPSRCHPACRFDDEDEWIIYTHLRADGTPGIVQLALRLDDPGLSGYCQAAISTTKGSPREPLQQYPDPAAPGETPVYFLLPTRFGKKDRDGNRRPLPGPSDNITIAGMQYLYISVPDEGERVVRLCTYPSSVSAGDYRLILNDLVLVHRQLLMGQGVHTSMSVGERCEAAALDVGKQAARMKAILHGLEAAPERELVAVPSRVPGHKVKKRTAKTLIDQAAGKRLLRTELHGESFNIYEHRMIRTYLENLKVLVGQYSKLEERERKTLAGEPISPRAQQAAQYHLDCIARRMLPRRDSPLQNCPAPYKRGHLYVRGFPGVGKIEARELAVSCFTKYNWAIMTCKLVGLKAPVNQLKMPIDGNGWQVLFFLYCLNKLKERWEAEKNSLKYLTVNLSGRYTVSNWSAGDRSDVTIYELEYVDIQGVGVLRLEDVFPGPLTDERMVRYLMENSDGSIPDGKDELFYHASLLERARFQKSGLPAPHDWDSLGQQIDRMLASPILRGVGSGERLHTSNLFAKHRRYSQAYRLMRENQSLFESIEPWEDGSLPVDATHQIYELWCLLKMLSIWVSDYGFTLIKPSMNELTRQIIGHLHSAGQAVDTVVLRMERGKLAGMELRLDYDRERRFLEDVRERVLRPDVPVLHGCQIPELRPGTDDKGRVV